MTLRPDIGALAQVALLAALATLSILALPQPWGLCIGIATAFGAGWRYADQTE